jgi:chemotaxis protein CheD
MRAPASLPSGFDRGQVTTVNQGDCLTSDDPAVTFSTLLGSCVAACIRDVESGVGGMNHFLLAAPRGAPSDRFGASARYGAFAMEQLINKVLTRGSGKKANLEIKVFGGGKINSALDDVGLKNIEFVREFLSAEGYVAMSEDLGGNYARRVLFKPHSGRAFVKRLDSDAGANVAREEIAIAKRRVIVPAPVDDIELF